MSLRRSTRTRAAPVRFRFSAFAAPVPERAHTGARPQILNSAPPIVNQAQKETVAASESSSFSGDALDELKAYLARAGGFAVVYEGSRDSDASFTEETE